MKPLVTKILQTKLSRRNLVYTFVVALGFVASGMTSYGALADANYKAGGSILIVKDQIGSDLVQLNATWASKKTPAENLTALKDFKSGLLSHTTTICPGSNSLYFPLLSANTSCKTARERLATVDQSLADIASYIEGEAQLAKIITKQPKLDASFQEKADHWTSISKEIKSTEVTKALKPTQSRLIASIDTYAAAWTNLSKADTDKNKEAFTKGQSDLEAAHTALQAIGATSAVDLKAQMNELNTHIAAFLDLAITK